MATLIMPVGKYELGRVFSRTFSAIAANWIALFGFSLAVHAISSLAGSFSMAGFANALMPGRPEALLGIFMTPAYWITVFAGTFASMFAGAGLLAGLSVGEGGNSITIGDCVAGGVRFLLPMIGLVILWWIGILVGYILFLVPALILLTMWSASAPALVAERIGVFEAFGRSRALTKGFRWPVFGTLVLFLIGYLIAAGTLQGFSASSLIAGGTAQSFSASGLVSMYRSNLISGIIVTALVSSVLAVLMNAFLFALYQELREAKEGAGDAGLAEIFA